MVKNNDNKRKESNDVTSRSHFNRRTTSLSLCLVLTVRVVKEWRMGPIVMIFTGFLPFSPFSSKS